MQVKLAKQLVELSFADKAFFCNSGTEANEAAIKFARKYARVQGALATFCSHDPNSPSAVQPSPDAVRAQFEKVWPVTSYTCAAHAQPVSIRMTPMLRRRQSWSPSRHPSTAGPSAL